VRGIRDGGIGYGVLRYQRGEVEGWKDGEVSFNYLGQLDQVVREGSFRIAEESAGAGHDQGEKRQYLIDITCRVYKSKLEASFVYSKRMYQNTSIKRLVSLFNHHLSLIIKHCLNLNGGVDTPSDFPLALLDARKLQRLSNVLKMIDEEN
jgi:non-ribosomal peptide synthase protein (TIGR01720 family)